MIDNLLTGDPVEHMFMDDFIGAMFMDEVVGKKSTDELVDEFIDNLCMDKPFRDVDKPFIDKALVDEFTCKLFNECIGLSTNSSTTCTSSSRSSTRRSWTTSSTSRSRIGLSTTAHGRSHLQEAHGHIWCYVSFATMSEDSFMNGVMIIDDLIEEMIMQDSRRFP